MDPNLQLARMRDVHARCERAHLRLGLGSIHAQELMKEHVKLTTELDEWLSRDGILPDAWQAASERGKNRAAAQALELTRELADMTHQRTSRDDVVTLNTLIRKARSILGR